MTSEHSSGDDAQLHELRHRYRNSLQVMNSVVGLHARGITDPQAVQAFSDLRSRLSVIARIFTELDEEGGDTIDLGTFLPKIAHLSANLFDQTGACRLSFDMAHVDLLKTRAGMLAQILAELLMAAFRHAPAEADQRELGIKLRRDGEQLVLSLTNAVLGSEDENTAARLTLTIIKSLSMTLNATLHPAASGSGLVRLVVEMRT